MEPAMLTAKQLDTLNRPAPYSIRRSFLGEETVRRLLQYVEAHEREFFANKIGHVEKINKSVSVSLTLKQIGNFANEITSRVSSVLPNIFHELGCTPFKPMKYELLISAYGHGAFYTRHIDTWTGEV